MDKDIRELKLKLVQTLNESQISIEVKRLILSEVLHEVESLANQVISQQIEEVNKEDAESVFEDKLV